MHLRYKSLSRPGVILSYQLWRDEASIARWRSNENHHKSQIEGRYKHFKDYRIRVSRAIYCHAVQDDQSLYNADIEHSDVHDNSDRLVTIVRSTSLPESMHGEAFESVSETNSFLFLSDFSEQESGYEYCLVAQNDSDVISTILAKVSRDYSMHDRGEAPQNFTPVEK